MAGIKRNLENLRYINVYIVSIIYCCWKLKRIGIWKFKTVTFVNLFRKFDNSKLEIWKLMILLIPIFDIILIYWEVSILVIPFFEINFQEIFNVNDDEYKNSLLNFIFLRVTYIIACIQLYIILKLTRRIALNELLLQFIYFLWIFLY